MKKRVMHRGGGARAAAAGILAERARIHSEGVADGFEAFALVALIAGDNICEDFMTEETFGRFFSAWENEVGRIFSTQCENDPEKVRDLTMSVEGHTGRRREKYGLEVNG